MKSRACGRLILVARRRYGKLRMRVRAAQGCTDGCRSKNDGCGLNGTVCLPFSNNSFAFRCPAACVAGGQVLNPRAVGDSIALYQPFVIGGPPADSRNVTYRADSFICPSAVHAGLFEDRLGGCGIVQQIGERDWFAESTRNGISSIGFDAAFPSAYTFLSARTTGCADLRWHLFGVSIPFTVAITLLSTHAGVVLGSCFVGVFFHVALASDPPYQSNPYALVSTAVSRFLPAAFAAWTLYLHVLRPVHAASIFVSGRAAVERAVLFLAGLWFGALNNITFDAVIPIQRLTAHDLQQQPGARGALAIIVVIITAIAVGQVHYLRISGQLPTMLRVYAAFGVGLGLLAAIPGQLLRIHHYILALLLLPGTRTTTRPALLYQGLLLGLFINGIARWGWDGIIQTPAEIAGDQLVYSSIPRFDPVPEVGAGNFTVFWDPPPQNQGWKGVEVLVNDVERYAWTASGLGLNRTGIGANNTGNATSGGEFTWPWNHGDKLYFRLGYYNEDGSGDFTEAGVVERDGQWRPPGNGST